MTVRSIRYIVTADGRSYAKADTNGERWRCVVRPCNGPQHVEYFETAREAWGAMDALRKGQS